MFDNVIETLEIARDSVADHDHDKAFEAITILLMQMMDLFGHDVDFMGKMFPILENAKKHIQAEEYEDAHIIILSLLIRFREANDIEPE